MDRTDGPAAAGRATARTRTYRSVRREQQAAQTRELVLVTATRLFSERGWAATGMRDVAREAAVSVETVYSNFRTKSELLLAAIDVGVVGDTATVPLSDRPEFAALGRGTRAERLAATATLVTGINRRSWGLRRAINEAAASEPVLAAKVHELERRRRDNVGTAAALVTGTPVEGEVLDALWVVAGTEVFALLTQVGGRSVEEYTAWLEATFARLLGEAS